MNITTMNPCRHTLKRELAIKFSIIQCMVHVYLLERGGYCESLRQKTQCSQPGHEPAQLDPDSCASRLLCPLRSSWSTIWLFQSTRARFGKDKTTGPHMIVLVIAIGY